ncbi:MAG: bifunctional folylpolyglutamate synthase/dihydrofolate synthase [Sandaracinaceae bacterium]|nr:bifunctional folylpolyglutamate synthase/dihydrofolate synthase [Sandaracinaceae bacterium]
MTEDVGASGGSQAYLETIRWLYGLSPRGIRLELDRMRAACALAGDPQRALRVIHVAGTNGKGSTSAMIARIAQCAGLRVGLYTSPHLHSFAERVRIDGVPISRDEIVARVAAIRLLLAQPGAPELTFFEVTTLLAFQAFAERELDLVVLEVGLGGRLDATNVIERPLACVITHVDLDHQAYLGSTLAEIAREKAGIVKAGVPVVHAGDAPDEARGIAVRDVIDGRAKELGAPSIALGRELQLATTRRSGLDVCEVTLGDRRVEGLVTKLVGAHQLRNAALAVGAMLTAHPAIDDASIRAGIASVSWPGRLESIECEGVTFLFDAAHNPDGARTLAWFLEATPSEGRHVLLFGAMADKAWREMLAILVPHVDEVVAVAPPLGRAEKADVIAREVAGHAAATVIEGVEESRRLAGQGGTVIVCGSIFVLAEARAHVLGITQEPLIAM